MGIYLKLFAEFLDLTMKGEVRGRLDPRKPRADTGSIRGAMRRFCNAWERENHWEIPYYIEQFMALFIDGELADKIGLTKSRKNGTEKELKTPLTIENYVYMQERYWYNDFHEYLYKGYRVDSTNLSNNCYFTSARLTENLEYRLSWKYEKPEYRLKFKREVYEAINENCFGLYSARRKALINANVLRFASQNNTHVLVNDDLGNISSIDDAANYLRAELRTDLVEDFLSAITRRNPGISQTLPVEVEEELG
ncbi:hypothetical protein GGS23DRAFT_594031 [Durotheca rogersii]|uniref:uncharacterized protein n=1 Tax=Durotheca rogersii TaxID=419775 RepID=UPI00221F8181|nr:uncharacterized protein GGS23DRAFT_594031 [Durotheca rogersii]KAI5865864.1 hypothetical protein GGS23DRAFT_594031 [Durotheca rogersii]